MEPVIGSFNYANYEYKTCQIGDKIWFAENFSCGNTSYLDPISSLFKGFFGESYGKNIGKDTDNQKYGRLYTWKEACDCVPDGWRLPTIEDFQDMVAYIESLRYDAGSALKSKKQWHGESDQGLDLFGFCAYPTVLKNGESQAWFWTASATGENDYPHYCVCLSANNNELNLTSKATDGYQACVRYVRDIE